MIWRFVKFALFMIDDPLARLIAAVSWIAVLWIVLVSEGYAASLHERDYQEAWCSDTGAARATVEQRLRDGARVDCIRYLDKEWYAIEFDFAYKWAEAIGQAMYYARMKGMKPGIVLIVTDFERERRYVERILFAIQDEGIRLWFVTDNDVK